MKNLSNRVLFTIWIFLVLFIAILSYFTYTNINKINSVGSIYKEKNRLLDSEIKLKSESINVLKSKFVLDKDDLDNIDEINKKYEEFSKSDEKFKTDVYNNFFLSPLNANYNQKIYFSFGEAKNVYRKLIVKYFGDDEVSDSLDAKNNFLIGQVALNDLALNDINEKIIENNNRVYKQLGLYNYINDSDKKFIKYKIQKVIKNARLEDENLYSQEEVRNFTEKTLYSKKMFLEKLNDSLYNKDNQNNKVLQEIENSQIEAKNFGYKSDFAKNEFSKEIENSINKSLILKQSIDAQNVDYIEGFEILDKTLENNEGVEVLRYLIDQEKRIYLVEKRLNGKPIKTIYYTSSALPYFELDIENSKEYYGYTNKEKNKYEDAKRLYKKF